ncbi:MAG TPA: hypothetical protein VMM80_09715 [Bacteroidota bacterium]|nr:hypothetical protein [Bacteroidota bacterium]
MSADDAGRRGRLAGLMDARRDILWGVLWVCGLLACRVWIGLRLNAPARRVVVEACMNTFWGALAAVALALLAGWGTALLLHALETGKRRTARLVVSFALNLLRSVPQIVGMLIGYVIVTSLTLNEALASDASRIAATSAVTALFMFQEVTDLVTARIRHFAATEFVDALLVCGVSPRVIINREILLKNSFAYLVQKSVALFGRAIFLICSIDFIVSVGLSTQVSLANLPVTLGSLLAKMDSKQDILAIGTALTDASVIPTLLVEHLQGISVAFLIVYTLLCVYRIANGLTERYRL